MCEQEVRLRIVSTVDPKRDDFRSSPRHSKDGRPNVVMNELFRPQDSDDQLQPCQQAVEYGGTPSTLKRCPYTFGIARVSIKYKAPRNQSVERCRNFYHQEKPASVNSIRTDTSPDHIKNNPFFIPFIEFKRRLTLSHDGDPKKLFVDSLIQMCRLSVGKKLLHVSVKQILGQDTILVKPESERGRVLLVSRFLAFGRR